MKIEGSLQKAATIFKKHHFSLLPCLPIGHHDLWVNKGGPKVHISTINTHTKK